MLRAGWLLAVVIAFGLSSQTALGRSLACPERPQPAGSAATAAVVIEQWLQRYFTVLGLNGAVLPERTELIGVMRGQGNGLLDGLGQLSRRCAQLVQQEPQATPAQQRRLRAELLTLLWSAAPEGPAAAARPARLAAIEQAIGLTPAELWRRLWYRDPSQPLGEASRWAAIVASPATEAAGYELLQAYQRRWPAVHFELQPPYRAGAPLALIIGRRLSQANAIKLLDLARVLGLPADAFIWPVPIGAEVAG